MYSNGLKNHFCHQKESDSLAEKEESWNVGVGGLDPRLVH